MRVGPEGIPGHHGITGDQCQSVSEEKKLTWDAYLPGEELTLYQWAVGITQVLTHPHKLTL